MPVTNGKHVVALAAEKVAEEWKLVYRDRHAVMVFNQTFVSEEAANRAAEEHWPKIVAQIERCFGAQPADA